VIAEQEPPMRADTPNIAALAAELTAAHPDLDSCAQRLVLAIYVVCARHALPA
jgi:hypothetical protein